MECERWEGRLVPYLEDDLGAVERRAVEDHLQACPACRELMELLRSVQVSLRSIPEVEPSPALQRRLASGPDRKKRFRFGVDFLLKPSLQPMLAAATVVLTLISFYAFSPRRSSINKSLERHIHVGYHKIAKLYTQAESLASSLAGYKDSLMVSLQTTYPLQRDEE
jgi:predicted anti-sigma-YlaC factor YlaD